MGLISMNTTLHFSNGISIGNEYHASAAIAGLIYEMGETMPSSS